MFLRTPIDLGAAIRDRRRRLKLGQDALARRVGASRKWIIDIEKGKPRAEIGLVLRTLDALGLRLSATADDEPGRGTSAADAAVPSVDIDEVLDRMRDRRS